MHLCTSLSVLVRFGPLTVPTVAAHQSRIGIGTRKEDRESILAHFPKTGQRVQGAGRCPRVTRSPLRVMNVDDFKVMARPAKGLAKLQEKMAEALARMRG